MGCLFLFQGIFLTQGSNPNLLCHLYWQEDGFFTAEPLGKPMKSTTLKWGFPDSSVGKESVCNAGDPGLIPGSGGSAEEGIGYPLQYSWASLVAQLVKNLPITQKTWVQSLCWEDPLKGMATHCSILAWRIPQNIQSMGSQRVRHNWVTFNNLKKKKKIQFWKEDFCIISSVYLYNLSIP